RFSRDWSSDVCSSDLDLGPAADPEDPLHEVLDAGASALAPDDEPAHEHDGTSDVGDSGSDVVADSGEHFDDLRDAGAPSGAVGRSEERRVGEGGGARE